MTDDNPFATPSDSNPFGGSSGQSEADRIMNENPFDNPFAKAETPPAYTASPTTTTKPAPKKDNPFEGSSKPASYGTGAASGPPAGGRVSHPVGNGSESEAQKAARLSQMESDLQRMERELREKERALAEREKATAGIRVPNWPRCMPIVRHDIREEIPADVRGMVRKFYAFFFLTCLCYVWNLVVIFACLFVKGIKVEGGAVALSCFYVVIGPLVAAIFWYFPIYNACRLAKSRYFVMFFINYFIQIAAGVFFLIGITSSGSAGIILMIDLFKAKLHPLDFMCLAQVILWGLYVICGVYLFKTAHSYYRGRGGNFTQDARKVAGDVAVEGATASLL